MHAVPHEIPLGALLTTPEPVTLTWRAKTDVNVALTFCATAMDIVQVGPVVDLHAPLQAEKTLPSDGLAVSTMLVPLGKSALHVVPHEMPAGALVTLPEPVTLTWSPKTGVKVALTLCAAVMGTLHVGVVLD